MLASLARVAGIVLCPARGKEKGARPLDENAGTSGWPSARRRWTFHEPIAGVAIVAEAMVLLQGADVRQSMCRVRTGDAAFLHWFKTVKQHFLQRFANGHFFVFCEVG